MVCGLAVAIVDRTEAPAGEVADTALPRLRDPRHQLQR